MGPISLAKQFEMFNNNSLKAKTRSTVVRGMNKVKEKPTKYVYALNHIIWLRIILFYGLLWCGREKKNSWEQLSQIQHVSNTLFPWLACACAATLELIVN